LRWVLAWVCGDQRRFLEHCLVAHVVMVAWTRLWG
jgi:hypothetical protein